MDDLRILDQAIARREKDIERLQKYVEQLREAERELAALRDARRIVARDMGIQEVVAYDATPPAQIRTPGRRPMTQGSLTADIVRALDVTAHDMSLDELQREIEKTRGPINRGTLTGTLSRLLKDKRIVKIGAARYAGIKLVSPHEINTPGEALQPSSNGEPSGAVALVTEEQESLS
jgi:hypothetical protein